MVISDNSVTSLISHDRGGEWKIIPLTEEQCKGVTKKVSVTGTRTFTVHLSGR